MIPQTLFAIIVGLSCNGLPQLIEWCMSWLIQ